MTSVRSQIHPVLPAMTEQMYLPDNRQRTCSISERLLPSAPQRRRALVVKEGQWYDDDSRKAVS